MGTPDRRRRCKRLSNYKRGSWFYFARIGDPVFGKCESLARRGYMFARTAADATAPTEFYLSDAGIGILYFADYIERWER